MAVWKDLFARERRTERSQAVARIVITAALVGYQFAAFCLDANSTIWTGGIILTAGYLVYSFAHYFTILRWPQPSILRRGAVIIGDLAMVSGIMHALGESGSFVYPLYLWIIVGNGLRFGTPYLFFALAVGLVSFAFVGYATPFWRDHGSLTAAMLVGLGILPLFYATLLREIESTHRRLARQVEESAHAATHDALTGLANRHLLRDRLAQALEHARRRGPLVAVLFIDLDGFKKINDTLGHGAGDELLRQVAGRLSETLRRADSVARYGGDEFVAVLDELYDEEAVRAAVKRTAAVFAEPFTLNGRPHRVGGSIGVSLFPRDGEDVDKLLQRADRAMYEAKDQSGSRIHMLSALDKRASETHRAPVAAAKVKTASAGGADRSIS